MSNTELEKLTFEEAMYELEKLVDSLDKGDVSLDEAIAAYDKGSQLKDFCQTKLIFFNFFEINILYIIL